MYRARLTIFPYLLVLIFLLKVSAGRCQINTHEDTANSNPLISTPATNGSRAGLKVDTASFETMEYAISRKERLTDIERELENRKHAAIKAHDDILLARSLNDLMRIRDLRTEDTLYFRNCAFMETVLRDHNASVRLKSIIHVLHAQRLHNFDHRSLGFNPGAYRTNDLKENYAALTSKQRDDIVASDLEAAMNARAFDGDASRLLWLSSNPDVFLFTPKFEDIILTERINLTPNLHYNYDMVGSPIGRWSSLPSARFRKLLDSISGIEEQRTTALSGYQQWLSFNKSDKATAQFIESLARKYIFLSFAQDSVSRQAYAEYLLETTSSPYPAFSAHAVYQLCLLWNEDGNKYADFNDGYQFIQGGNFDKKYQYLPKKALQLLEQHNDLISNYPTLKRVLGLMAKQILRSGVRVEMEDKFIPGENIPVKGIYKNKDTLYYRIIKVGPGATLKDNKGLLIPLLLNRPAVTDDKFDLPLPDDHNNHATYLKLPALANGNYCLLFSPQKIAGNSGSVNAIAFQVTRLAAINSDKRLYVLDRKTGLPLAGAAVRSFKKHAAITGGVTEVGKTGYTTISGDKVDSIEVSYRGDTLRQAYTARSNSLPDNVFDKDVDNSLDDFYEDKIIMHVFTDRSIYRPGQTVQYKIIFLTKDAQTGVPILLNSKNVGSAFFKDKLNKWLKEHEDVLKLTDPYRHIVDSVKITVNEFGSFAGSFALPKAAATGQWAIQGQPSEDYRNGGNFQVEEYKRPTIELTAEKPKKTIRIGEPFTVKLKLRSFSGADLNDIRIKYTLHRNGGFRATKGNQYKYFTDTLVMDTVGRTDKNGELLVVITDTLPKGYSAEIDGSLYYSFSLHAVAVDATGESSEVDEGIELSNRPVRISIAIDKIYDRQTLPILNVATTSIFEGAIGRPVTVKLYRVSDPDKTGTIREQVDQWYYAETDWNKWFPQLTTSATHKTKERTLVLDTTINTGLYQKLALPKDKLLAGFYELKAVCNEGGKITGEADYEFKVFDSQAAESPVDDIDYLSSNAAKPGETVTWFSSAKDDRYAIYELTWETTGKNRSIKNLYQEVSEKAGLRRWTCQLPSDAIGTALLTRVFVRNNQIFQKEKRLFLVLTAAEPPDIIIEKYRKVMAPGAKESFTVSIKTKNDNVAAELMTTLYDASLDKLQQHQWYLPYPGSQHAYFESHWNYSLSATRSSGDYGQSEPQYFNKEDRLPHTFGADKPLMLRELEGRVAGLGVTDASGLNEVVVKGYSSVRRSFATGSSVVVNVRGSTSILDYKQPLIVLDGQAYAGDLKDIAPASINQIMVLKGADASAIYGARAAGGVLIISTKGPIVLPGSEEPVIKIRKNFNETAFFFPQVHAGADGYYHFSFTMPETATEWNWKILAHTRNAQFAYLEKKLQTQLNLMVQPNVPRLLYQGDQVKLQSRISNLDTSAVSGKISCKIEDAVTGQDITTTIVSNHTLNFNLNGKSSGAESFLLTVPAEQSNPLKIVITVTGGSASDAEEHIIPVLSSKVFVRQSVAVHFKNNQSVSVTTVNLPKDAQLYGIGISIDQKPQAALLNALPWLAGYSYDCAEQTFNKLRARAIALKLMQNDTAARAAFKKATLTAEKTLAKGETLPDELAAEAMPWLSVGNLAADQQKQLYRVLDTMASKNDIDNLLEKLYKMQQPDGGLAWFEGGRSNAYISAYVLAGFGQLQKEGWLPRARYVERQKQFIELLYKYDQAEVLAQDNIHADIFSLYALSYWKNHQDESAAIQEKANKLLSTAWQNHDKANLEEQALLIITTLRFTKNTDPLNKKAEVQLEIIKQLAISDTENGLRWKSLSDSEELGGSAEETMALLSEAFELSGKHKEVDAGMLKWILTTRQDQHWKTTKATAAAIKMLQKQQGSTFGDTKAFTADLAGQHLAVSDGLLDGTPVAFAPIKQLPAAIHLQQQGHDANGAVTWYYFAEAKQLDTLSKGISIRKQFYIEDKAKGWVELPSGTVLNAGDKVRVKLTIETASRLKFVHISDPRAAAFEPKDNISGYQYENAFSYYRSVKDTGLELFTESVPRGISEIKYELVVAMSGHFTCGPARLQCMYQPSVTAYSNSRAFVSN